MNRTIARVALFAGAAWTVGCSVSTQQEVELGTNYAQQINSQLPIVQDPEVNRYINVLGDSLAGLSDDRDLDWHFYVVDSREVNAFAVPGGFIYVNRGLIERADNLSQLAGVLGHEIAHVTERHSIQQMQKAQTANIGVGLACVLTRVCESQAAGAAINVAGSAVFARFSRQDESESDAKAVEYVVRADISPQGIPQMFEKLMAERQSRPDGVAAWFSTHPLEEDRITATRAHIARIDPAILRGLTMDTPNFQAFKRRVQSLPPSPAPRG
jgi:predicted Zn-dependent protease